ncbi:HNH endonuclease [Klebsiella pneumoniae]|uniref:HNH endonuclease n=1 Tax=Klebsiella pneumoniae TaxID=573 RepID=UPI00286B02E4|nr:HNH endonuclease [Klebsiella pneumoniae]
MKTQPATGETYPKSDLFNKAFEKVYGEHGKGFIHVHHIKPLHTVGDNYVVNPIEDMVPLCPNCHAMIHRGSEVLSVDGLKDLLR